MLYLQESRRQSRGLLLLVLLMAGALFRASQTPKAPSTSDTESFQIKMESQLTEKAEKVLRGFGESEPLVTVTVEVEVGKTERERFDPDNFNRVLEDRQITCESLTGNSLPEAQLSSLSEGLEKPQQYDNTRESEHYMVGQRKTKFLAEDHRRVTRLSCLVQVSGKNVGRLRTIEESMRGALGARESDTVIAAARH